MKFSVQFRKAKSGYIPYKQSNLKIFLYINMFKNKFCFDRKLKKSINKTNIIKKIILII